MNNEIIKSPDKKKNSKIKLTKCKTKEQIANATNHPFTLAGNAISKVSKAYNANVAELIADLQMQSNKIFYGDVSRIEDMLIAQAHVLQAITMRATEKIANAETLNQVNVWGDLCMKAQNNCRKTLLTIAEIKNPRNPTFIKQQNNSLSQQINQGNLICSKEKTQVLEEKKVKNELDKMEINYATMDAGSQTEAISVNSSVATMDNGSRPKN